MNQFKPSGNYTLILAGLAKKQAGIGNAVEFVLDIHEVAVQYYGLNAEFDDATLEQLLLKLAESGQSTELYLETLFGVDNMNTRLALKRLLEIPADNLWSAHIWALRRRLPGDSYIAKVMSEDVTPHNMLWKYVVGSALSVLPDVNAKKYAMERAEIVCRASKEDLHYGLPQAYGKLFPTLADYFSSAFDFGDATTTEYFNEYRRNKVSGSITDSFAKRAYDLVVPQIYPTRDAVIMELPTETEFNCIRWSNMQRLA